MAFLGSALAGQVFGYSDAEKAFRPWWDNFQDYLVYTLVMLGKSRTPQEMDGRLKGVFL